MLIGANKANVYNYVLTVNSNGFISNYSSRI